MGVPGIIDQNINILPFIRKRVNGFVNSLFIANIEDQIGKVDRLRQLSPQCFEPFLSPATSYDMKAFFSQGDGCCPADARSGASYECYFTFHGLKLREKHKLKKSITRVVWHQKLYVENAVHPLHPVDVPHETRHQVDFKDVFAQIDEASGFRKLTMP